MNILFICKGNVARSQEAAAFLEQLRPDIQVRSAGTNVTVGKPLDPVVVEVMGELGLKLEAAYRKQLDDAQVEWADRIISFVPRESLTPQAAAKAQYWTVEDPRAQSIQVHRHVRDQIQELVKGAFAPHD
jgi:protein-tyrosine-phosphatase